MQSGLLSISFHFLFRRPVSCEYNDKNKQKYQKKKKIIIIFIVAVCRIDGWSTVFLSLDLSCSVGTHIVRSYRQPSPECQAYRHERVKEKEKEMSSAGMLVISHQLLDGWELSSIKDSKSKVSLIHFRMFHNAVKCKRSILRSFFFFLDQHFHRVKK